jgi:hypothetical protein
MREQQEQNEQMVKRALGGEETNETIEASAIGMIMSTAMTSLLYANKDIQAFVCPVLAVRMQGSEGREIADTVRSLMRDWDDDAVTQ